MVVTAGLHPGACGAESAADRAMAKTAASSAVTSVSVMYVSSGACPHRPRTSQHLSGPSTTAFPFAPPATSVYSVLRVVSAHFGRSSTSRDVTLWEARPCRCR